MKCLCCGKDIDKNGENGWHKSCIKRFFGASKLPEIEIDDETLKKLADETVNNGLTVPGVQKKLSLHLISENKSPKLTIVNFLQVIFSSLRCRSMKHCPKPNIL